MDPQNHSPNEDRCRFSLFQLMVAVTVICMLLALLAPSIQKAREAARRAHCVANLKNMGLAVHNYEGVYQEIPPSTLATLGGSDSSTSPPTSVTIMNSVSWGVLLIPYLEGYAVYRKCNLSGLTYAEVNSKANGNPLGQDAACVQIYLCPSRRTGIHRPKGWAAANGTNGGTCSDYAAVACPLASFQDKGIPVGHTASANCFQTYQTAIGINPIELYGGAMLGADRYGNGGQNVRSFTTFASISDGLSNTLLIGEKNICRSDLGDPNGNAGDANFYYSDTGEPTNNQKSSIRVIQHPTETLWSTNGINSLGRNRANEVPASTRATQANIFGSWHSWVVQFVFADGAVKQIRTNADKTVLFYLACRADNAPVNVDDH